MYNTTIEILPSIPSGNPTDIQHILKKAKKSQILLVEPFLTGTDTLNDMLEHHQNQEDTSDLFNQLRNKFFQLARHFSTSDALLADINDDFVEMEWILDDPAEDNKAFVKDQLLTVMTVISSRIVFGYYHEEDATAHWIDARDLFLADNNYGNGNLLEEESKKRCRTVLKIIHPDERVIIPAGIAATTENFNITLGENGSTKILQLLKSV